MLHRRAFVTGALGASACAHAPVLTHPGWTQTRGGAGGAVLRVTNLNAAGAGSLRAALETSGPRTIVFDVGGVIDLELATLRIAEPFVTIAGETAPAPGISLIRGGVSVATHDVIVRHIAVRPGTAGQTAPWEPDGLSAHAAHDVIVDHCSFTWAVDENLSASGPRFQGASVEHWRRNTSHRITLSNNIIAEGLAHATHSKGEHSKGTLIHDNCTEVLLFRNLYAHNMERHPLAKGGSRCAIVNNVFFNPGRTCAQYTLVEREWVGHEPVAGEMSLVGNVMRGGAQTPAGLAMLTFGGAGDLYLFEQDNRAHGSSGDVLPIVGRYTARADGMPAQGQEPSGRSAALILQASALHWPEGLPVLDSANLEASVLGQSGARPWARDAIDARIVADVRNNRGCIIDSQDDVGGYPTARARV